MHLYLERNYKMADKQNFQTKEKYSGVFAPTGKEVKFNRTWSNYRFSDEECEALLSGNEIHIRPMKKDGKGSYDCYGQLAQQSFTNAEGKQIVFYGFKPDFETKRVPSTFCQYTFAEDEIKALNAGETIYCMGLIGKSGKQFNAYLRFNTKDGLQMSFNNGEEE